MHRRTFLWLPAFLALLAPATARSEEDELGEGFLAQVLVGAYNSTRPVAELVDRARFYLALTQTNQLLGRMLRQKQTIRDQLRRSSCPGQNQAFSNVAFSNAASLSSNLQQLQDAAYRLSDAAADDQLRARLKEAASKLDATQVKRAWVDSVQNYCRMPPAERAKFLGRIQSSIVDARRAQDAVQALQHKLRP